MLEVDLLAQAYDLWHDRAVFHFLTAPEDRRAYVRQVLHAVRPKGLVIVATFAEDGATQCSGLDVMRYSAFGLKEAPNKWLRGRIAALRGVGSGRRYAA